MLYRLITQNGDTFYSALCDDNTITDFRQPFGAYSIDEVFDDKHFFERDPIQISTVKQLLHNTQSTNHVLIPIDLTYSQFLDQYPEWNI